MEASLRHTIKEEMHNLASAAADSIHHFLNHCQEDAQAVVANLPLKVLEEKDAAQAERYLGYMMALFPKVANCLFLLDAQGVLWADEPSHLNTRGSSFAFREYFQRTLQEGRGIMGRPSCS